MPVDATCHIIDPCMHACTQRQDDGMEARALREADLCLAKDNPELDMFDADTDDRVVERAHFDREDLVLVAFGITRAWNLCTTAQ